MYIIKYAAVLLAALFVLLLGSCGKNSSDNTGTERGQREVLSRENNAVEDIDMPEETPLTVYYDIKLENNIIKMYEVSGGLRIEIKALKIDTGYYPEEDIRQLTDGITVYSREKAYEILENFAN